MNFENGTLKKIQSGAKAGNATYDLQPPVGRRYKLLAASFTVTTDATVANRYFNFAFYDGATLIGQIAPNSTAVTASQTKYTDATQYEVSNSAGAVRLGLIGVGDGWIVTNSIYTRFWLLNGVAGDSWQVDIIVSEIPE